MTTEQFQELCAAVFGSHDMWYPAEPTRLVFRDTAPYELLRRDFDGVCRRCNIAGTRSEYNPSAVCATPTNGRLASDAQVTVMRASEDGPGVLSEDPCIR